MTGPSGTQPAANTPKAALVTIVTHRGIDPWQKSQSRNSDVGCRAVGAHDRVSYSWRRRERPPP